MIETTLYIDDQKVDMYESTGITLNDSIKQTKDVGNVNTSFTREFKLPASKTNNQIFEHYYNTLIRNGFDSRRKHDALIKLNGADFRKGYIKLNGVDLEDNKAKSYRVQFFGELSSLKDRMGEDMLEDLRSLNRFNHEYNIATVRGGFEQGYLSTGGGLIQDPNGDLIYPFISHTRGFKLDNQGLYDLTQTGAPTLPDRLSHTDLKPAIRVDEILTAMEFQYDISFVSDFRNGDNFQDLFLWLHREKGGVKNGSQNTDNIALTRVISDGTDPNEFPLFLGPDQRVLETWDENNQGEGGQYYECELDFTTVSGGNYEVTVTTTNSEGAQFIDQYVLEDNATVNFNIVSRSNIPVTWRIDVDIYADSNLLDLTPTLTIERFLGGATQDVGTYGGVAVPLLEELIITNLLPKMRCIDFLRGLMKLFNLVAYEQPVSDVSAEYDIVLEPLDVFYDKGVAVDLTKWVNISNASVERVEPFNLIRFEFPEPETLFVKKTNELARINFGNAFYDTRSTLLGQNSSLYDGGEYSIEVPFEKAQFPRLINEDTEVLSQLQWGWFVNDFTENSPEPELGAPLLFFRNSRECDVNAILWNDGGTTNTNYNAPSNVSTDQNNTLNFDSEIDEYTLEVNENGLFNKQYRRYIEGIYDIDARRYKVELYLPPNYIFNYKLNDKVFINYTPFNIENISINTLNGKTSLELLKITAREEVYDVEPKIIPVNNLVYYCRFNNSLTDETGNNTSTNDGSDYGDGLYTGNSLEAFRILSRGECSYINDNDVLSFGDGVTDQPFSISFAFNMTNAGQLEAGFRLKLLLNKRPTSSPGTNSEYQITTSDSTTPVLGFALFDQTGGNDNIRIEGSTTIVNSTTYHAVCTYDGSGSVSGLKMYIDGVEETVTTFETGGYVAMNNTTSDVYLGKPAWTDDFGMRGRLDGMGIWNKELTQAEVTAIYETQSAGFEIL